MAAKIMNETTENEKKSVETSRNEDSNSSVISSTATKIKLEDDEEKPSPCNSTVVDPSCHGDGDNDVDQESSKSGEVVADTNLATEERDFNEKEDEGLSPKCFTSTSISSSNNKSSSTVWPLRDIKEPHANDVLYGRGGGTNHHPGNKRYRKWVEDRKMDYLSSKRLEKPLVALEIIRDWRGQDPPGRFLKQDESTGLWHDVGDKKAREKTSQALREKAPQLKNPGTCHGTVTRISEKELHHELVEAAAANNNEHHHMDDYFCDDPDQLGHRVDREYDDRQRTVEFEFDNPASNHHRGGDKQGRKSKFSRAVLLRDHSLGRDYLKPDEAISLQGFSWNHNPRRSPMRPSPGELPHHPMDIHSGDHPFDGRGVNGNFHPNQRHQRTHSQPIEGYSEAIFPVKQTVSTSSSSFLPNRPSSSRDRVRRTSYEDPAADPMMYGAPAPPLQSKDSSYRSSPPPSRLSPSGSRGGSGNGNLTHDRQRRGSRHMDYESEIFQSWSTGHTDERGSNDHVFSTWASSSNPTPANHEVIPSPRNSSHAPNSAGVYSDQSVSPSSSTSSHHPHHPMKQHQRPMMPDPYGNYRGGGTSSSPYNNSGYSQNSSHPSSSSSPPVYSPEGSGHYLGGPGAYPRHHRIPHPTPDRSHPPQPQHNTKDHYEGNMYYEDTRISHPYEEVVVNSSRHSSRSPRNAQPSPQRPPSASHEQKRRSGGSQHSNKKNPEGGVLEYFSSVFDVDDNIDPSHRRVSTRPPKMTIPSPHGYKSSMALSSSGGGSSSLERPCRIKRDTSNQAEQAETKKDTKLIKRAGLNRENSLRAMELREAQRAKSSLSRPPQSIHPSPYKTLHDSRHSLAISVKADPDKIDNDNEPPSEIIFDDHDIRTISTGTNEINLSNKSENSTSGKGKDPSMPMRKPSSLRASERASTIDIIESELESGVVDGGWLDNLE